MQYVANILRTGHRYWRGSAVMTHSTYWWNTLLLTTVTQVEVCVDTFTPLGLRGGSFAHRALKMQLGIAEQPRPALLAQWPSLAHQPPPVL